VVEASFQGLDGVVVLILSTYEADEYAPRAAEVGAVAYMPKSEFEPDRLADAWSAAGGRKRE
jgi:DNA-binding NarL/FixJ family response regulator